MDLRQVLRSVLLLFVFVVSVPRAQEVAWVANGRDLEGTRYLPASEITRDNVGRLQVAWTYRTGEADESFKTKKPAAFEATPLVIDGTMFVGTPLGRVMALDAATGRELWVFDPKIARDVEYRGFRESRCRCLARRESRSGRAVPASDFRLDRSIAAVRD